MKLYTLTSSVRNYFLLFQTVLILQTSWQSFKATRENH